MSEVNVIRKDIFELDNSEFNTPGCYVLKKRGYQSNQNFLDELLIVETSASASNLFIGQIANYDLYHSIEDGDIGIINSSNTIRVILSHRANHNTVLVTERCDNLCLFCSQPPKIKDDSWLLTQASLAIAAFNSSDTVGVSGGEPLIYKNDFLTFLDFLIEHTPTTQLHILTNGRAFSDPAFTKEIKARSTKVDLCFGVPLYSSLPSVHNKLVGSDDAFNETVIGLINAGNIGLNIELRIIPTAHNLKELPTLVEYAGRTFSNISQISIMNLEPEGFARKNWDKIYVMPSYYSESLLNAVKVARRNSLRTLLFNFPLCHIPINLHTIAVQSISDWKNYYPDECNTCSKKAECGGYFKSSKGRYHQLPKRINHE
jgi:His-Xaa-Ser system radical SAM maturase HxsC